MRPAIAAAMVLTSAVTGTSCGPACRMGGEYTEFSSFEGTLDGWVPGAQDGSPSTWTIAPSTDRGICGTQSLKFALSGPSAQWPQSLWIEKEFPVAPQDHYQANLDLFIGTEDDNERQTDTGIKYLSVGFFLNARTGLNASDGVLNGSDTFKPAGSGGGFQWVPKPMQLDVPRTTSGKITVRLGFNPNTNPVPSRTYYLDDVRLFFRPP